MTRWKDNHPKSRHGVLLLVEPELSFKAKAINDLIDLAGRHLEVHSTYVCGHFETKNDLIIDRAIFIDCNVTDQTGKRCPEIGYCSPCMGELRRPWEFRQRVGSDMSTYDSDCASNILRGCCVTHTLADRVQARVNAYQRDARPAGNDIRVHVVRGRSVSELLPKLKERQEHCHECNDGGNPATYCRNCRPVHTAIRRNGHAGNHHFGSDHRTISIWVRRHCAMEAGHG